MSHTMFIRLPLRRLAGLSALPAWLLAAALLAGTLPAEAQTPGDAREQAVMVARAGDTAAAIEQLQALWHQARDTAVLHDLIAVHHWHGNHSQAVALSAELAIRTTPPWVLENVAGAWRALDEPLAAAQWYEFCVLLSDNGLDCALAAAQSYAEAGQDKRAAESLQALARQHPENAEVHTLLARHQLETGHPQAALATMDTLVDNTATTGGPAHIDARRRAAVARAWTEDLPGAQAGLEALLEDAPEAVDARMDLATIYRWRGWPRRALAQYELILEQDRSHAGAMIGKGEILGAAGEYHQARLLRQELRSFHPSEPARHRLRSSERRNRGWHLNAHVATGRADSATFGSRDMLLGWRLNAPMHSRHSRVYVWQTHEWARFPEGNGNDTRFGVGLEQRRMDWHARGEIHGSTDSDLDRGAELWLAWTGSDHLRFEGRLDSSPAEVPLRGRNQGVTGELAQFTTRYTWHERRNASVSFTAMDFDDDNRRRSVSGLFTQRVHTRPRWQLDGELGLYTSNNSLDPAEASYFNPTSDLSLTAGLNSNWQTWRGNGRALDQRTGVYAGSYSQEGAGGDVISGARYEHVWTLRGGQQLRYGGSAARRVYDGDAEGQFAVFAAIDWWFSE